MNRTLEGLPDHELLGRTHALVRRGRAVEAELLSHLGVVDARRLYLEQACSSMFVYCVRELHFSEAAAYKRIRAARAVRKHPELLPALERGELHLTAVSLLATQLTDKNRDELIEAATHKTAEEIKRLLADRQPKPDVADCVRRVAVLTPIPAPTTTRPALAPDRARPGRAAAAPRESSPARTAPLGGERYRVSFTAGEELHAQLTELRALMRHQVPDGDLGSILGRAVALLLEQVRKRKFGDVSVPKAGPPAKPANRAASRHIPTAIRRAVVSRDAGRCRYVSPGGVRCDAAEFLEFHHIDPWARSGTHSVDGIALRCRAHNQHEARRVFGEEPMARFRKWEDSGPSTHSKA